VKAEAAEGLATFDEYAADLDKIYIEGKFEQLLSTIDLAKKHGGWVTRRFKSSCIGAASRCHSANTSSVTAAG
jgi:hypothetical protein